MLGYVMEKCRPWMFHNIPKVRQALHGLSLTIGDRARHISICCENGRRKFCVRCNNDTPSCLSAEISN